MPVACLCLAALVAVAAARLRRYWLVGLALVALVFDLHFGAYVATAAGSSGKTATALHSQPPGRLLELPVFLPDVDDGSVYLYGDMKAQRQRPEGYALGAAETDTVARELRPLDCGDWHRSGSVAKRLGVRYVAVHGGMFEYAQSAGEWFAWRALERHAYGPISQAGRVTMFAPGGSAVVGRPVEPNRGQVVVCDGWRDSDNRLVIPPGELWVHGPARALLRLDGTATAVVSADGHVFAEVRGAHAVSIPVLAPRWHLIRIDPISHGELHLVSARRLALTR